jgi:hypothetical protein
MCTETTRRQHCRDDLRYTSDLRDGEWAIIEPLLPKPRRLGRHARRLALAAGVLWAVGLILLVVVQRADGRVASSLGRPLQGDFMRQHRVAVVDARFLIEGGENSRLLIGLTDDPPCKCRRFLLTHPMRRDGGA